MSLFTKLSEAVHSWRRRRVGTKMSRKRSEPMMEQLDHRQLLAVNFTGVAANDFPVTTSPGVQVVTGIPINTSTGAQTNLPGANNQVPIVPEPFRPFFNVSGFEIDQLRVSYTAADDTLNVGVEGPLNGRNGNQVIAADSDNNGNSGTVDPRVLALDPLFADPADMGGTKTYGVSLEFNGATSPQIVAGFPVGAQTDIAAKPFQVARALQNTPSNLPQFDETQTLPQYTGNYYLANDPTRPNFEFQIPNFSQLYQQITGLALTSTSQISIGAFGTSQQDAGISDEVFAPLPLSVPQITVPTPTPPLPPVPTPMSPTTFVNYHEGNHVNTAHNGPIRVNVLGSSGFDPSTIIPSSVRFGDPATVATTGATPVLNFERNVNNDAFPDETFVFNGLDVKLPAGITNAEITGTTTSGQTFASTVRVFNRDATYYTPAQLAAQQARFTRYDAAHGIDTSNGPVAPPTRVPSAAQQLATSAAINDLYNPFAGKKVPTQINPSATSANAGTGVTTASVVPTSSAIPTVSIPKKHGKVTGKAAKVAAAKVSPTESQTIALSNLPTSLSTLPTSLNLAGGA